MQSIKIGGDDVSGITIDGDDVNEVTVEGETVWTAIPDSGGIHQWNWTE